jgi:cellulose synthase/poly-beta-1,6-N-acetylglucosamine synthase-like glycosyltransferase
MYFPGIELIVCNYQTPGDLQGFLQSWEASDIQVPNTLHVVNVSPGPEDRAVVEQWGKEHRFLYSQHDDNVGYGRACNHAALYPDREVIAFFNADTRLGRGVVDECYAALKRHPDWGILGPRQINSSGRITAGGVYGSLESPTFDNRWNRFDQGQFSDIREDCVSVSGSAYFVKRSVWDELTNCPLYLNCPEVAERQPLGAFLPTAHYYNETYTSYHALAHGHKVVYYGPAVMTHEWHRASPVGGYGEQNVNADRQLFRDACDFHGIPRE